MKPSKRAGCIAGLIAMMVVWGGIVAPEALAQAGQAQATASSLAEQQRLSKKLPRKGKKLMKRERERAKQAVKRQREEARTAFRRQRALDARTR